jgi:hypothetical protein
MWVKKVIRRRIERQAVEESVQEEVVVEEEEEEVEGKDWERKEVCIFSLFPSFLF